MPADLTTLLALFLQDLYAGTFGSSVPITAIRVGDGTAAAPSLSFASETDLGFYRIAADALGFVNASAQQVLFGTNLVQLGSGGTFAWCSTAGAGGASADLSMAREGAAHLFQRNTTTAERWSLANTYASTVSYESFSVDWQTTASTALVGTRTAATGTGRAIALVSQGTNAANSYAGLILNGVASTAQIATFNAAGTALSALPLTYPNANGQSFNDVQQLTELTTIAAAATTDTTIQMPAGAVVLGVSVRVTVVIPTAATMTVGDSGSAARFNTGASIAVAANTTDPGTKAGAYYNASALSVRFTPNATPANNSGRVRTTIYYYTITPPTS